MALATIDFAINAGLDTKAIPEDTSALTLAENVDFFERTGAIGKIPGSSRQSNTAPNQIDSILYYEFFDAANVFTREILLFAGGILYRRESDQTLTTLASGMTAEPLWYFVYDNRLFFGSANNDAQRYDGAQVLNAGLKAPGSTRTNLEGFSDSSGFTVNGSNGLSDNSASIDGDGSTQVDKTDTSTTDLTLNKTGLSLDISNAGDDDLFVILNIPRGALGKLASSGTVQITLGEAGLSDSDVHSFDIGSLAEGYNTITMDLTSPDSTNGAGATLSDVNEIELKIVFDAVSQTQSGFLWDFLYIVDDSTLTATVGGAGNVDEGDHAYRVSYISVTGIESNLGLSSNTITAASGGSQVSLTGIPVSPDSQVVARRIYRSQGGDATFRFLTTIEDNTTTTFTDNTADASLSTTIVPGIAGTAVDNSAPRRMFDATLWNGYGVGIDELNRFRLNFSAQAGATTGTDQWPVNSFLVFDAELKTVVRLLDVLLVFAADRIYRIDGGDTGFNSINALETSPDIGCVGRRAATKVKNNVIFWYDDGPYVSSQGGVNPWYVGGPIRDQIDDLSPTTFSDIHVVHDRTRYRILFFIQSTSGGAYDTIFVMSYGDQGRGVVSPEGQGVDPLDPRVAKWTKIVLPSGLDFRCSEMVESAADQLELWVGSNDADGGIAYRLQDPATSNWADGSQEVAVDAQFETTYEQISPISYEGRGFPRYLIVRGEADTQSTWTATVTVADDAGGPDLHSQDYTVTIGPGVTSQKIAVGRGLNGSFAKVKMRNNNPDQAGYIASIRLDCILRPARGVR